MKRDFWKLIGRSAAVVSFMLCGTAPALSQSASDNPPNYPPKWDAHIDLEGKLGTDRHLGEADLFLPLAQDDDTLLFGDIRFRLDDESSREGNFGLGLRHMLGSGWNLGAYGYYDRRRSPYDHYFSQLTFGVEALGRDIEFRANAYLPVGTRTRQVDSLSTATLSGTSVIFRGGEEHSLRGFDAEAGWRVPIFNAEANRQLRLYVGGYRFTADDVETVEGPRVRADFTMDDVPFLWRGAQVSVGAEVQHDDPRGTQAFAMLRLRVPLQVFGEGSRRLTAQERRMTAPVVRDVDIVTQAGAFGAPETATQLADGTAFSVIDSESTTGANLNTAVQAAGNGSTVILSGTFDLVGGAQQVTMMNGQTLMAGTITVRSPSGRLAPLTTSATIAGRNMGTVVEMPGNTTLQGLTVTGTRSDGIAMTVVNLQNTAANINIRDNTITLTHTGTGGGNALSAGAITNLVVSGNTLTATTTAAATANALAIAAGTTATVSGNTLSASSGGGTASYLLLNSASIQSGSTGNVAGDGDCNTFGTNTGSVGFTNANACQ